MISNIARSATTICAVFFLILLTTEALSESRYIVQKDTIIDKNSGLIWHKKGFSRVELLNAICPQEKFKEGVTCTLNTGTIQDYLATLKVEGVTGWRLPKSEEVETLNEFIDTNVDSGKPLFYITAAEDRTMLGFYTGKAHKFLERLYDEPRPDMISSPQVVVPVSGQTGISSRGASVFYKGGSRCGGRQLDVSFVYDTSSSTINTFKQVHACVKEISDGGGTISEQVDSPLLVKNNRFSSSLVAEGRISSSGEASGIILGQMKNMKVQCSDGNFYSNCSDWVAAPQQ